MSGDSYHCPDAKRLQTLKDIANKLRIHCIEATNASNSGYSYKYNTENVLCECVVIMM